MTRLQLKLSWMDDTTSYVDNQPICSGIGYVTVLIYQILILSTHEVIFCVYHGVSLLRMCGSFTGHF